MAKIAQKKPGITKRPVYVTKDVYEIWYAKPQSLGKIHNVRGYWYTADNKRFASSHDAMNYLITMIEAGKPVLGKFDPKSVQTRVIRRVLNEVTKRDLVPTEELITKAQAAANLEGMVENQNHPMFQEFLDFVNWKARRKVEEMRRGATAESTIAKVLEQ